MLLNEGMNELADQFADLIAKGQWGTGTTAATTSDTGLETAVATTLITPTSANSGASAQFTHTLPSTTGNGNSLIEYELQFTNGDSLTRSVGTAIAKTASFRIITISTINFVRGN